jgi:hypothetical protein
MLHKKIYLFDLCIITILFSIDSIIPCNINTTAKKIGCRMNFNGRILLNKFFIIYESFSNGSIWLPTIHGQSCCTTRHDTNTTKHDTIRHEHGWTRLPFVSCRVRRRAKTSTRTPCRVNTNTIHRKKNSSETIFSSIQHSTTQIQSQPPSASGSSTN